MFFCELIDLAGDFGGLVNIGRVRGQIGSEPREQAESRFIAMAMDLCEYALGKGVTLILEPVNRYEIDFINSVEEGVGLLKKINAPNMKLMPDTFHMNIEDRFIGETLAAHISDIAYLHLADSNRLAPGQGPIDFRHLFQCLSAVQYPWLGLIGNTAQAGSYDGGPSGSGIFDPINKRI